MVVSPYVVAEVDYLVATRKGVDASSVVLAQRYRTRTILTLDRKHFNVMRPLDGGVFKIVP